jgi:hypothetical protein
MMLRNFVDICYAHMNLNYPIFVDFYFLYVKENNEFGHLNKLFCILKEFAGYINMISGVFLVRSPQS